MIHLLITTDLREKVTKFFLPDKLEYGAKDYMP